MYEQDDDRYEIDDPYYKKILTTYDVPFDHPYKKKDEKTKQAEEKRKKELHRQSNDLSSDNLASKAKSFVGSFEHTRRRRRELSSSYLKKEKGETEQKQEPQQPRRQQPLPQSQPQSQPHQHQPPPQRQQYQHQRHQQPDYRQILRHERLKREQHEEEIHRAYERPTAGFTEQTSTAKESEQTATQADKKKTVFDEEFEEYYAHNQNPKNGAEDPMSNFWKQKIQYGNATPPKQDFSKNTGDTKDDKKDAKTGENANETKDEKKKKKKKKKELSPEEVDQNARKYIKQFMMKIHPDFFHLNAEKRDKSILCTCMHCIYSS